MIDKKKQVKIFERDSRTDLECSLNDFLLSHNIENVQYAVYPMGLGSWYSVLVVYSD